MALEDKKLTRAEELAKKAVSLQRENADAADTLAQIYIAKGDKAAALKLYEEVAASIANDDVYLNYVSVLLELEKRRSPRASWQVENLSQRQPSKERNHLSSNTGLDCPGVSCFSLNLGITILITKGHITVAFFNCAIRIEHT